MDDLEIDVFSYDDDIVDCSPTIVPAYDVAAYARDAEWGVTTVLAKRELLELVARSRDSERGGLLPDPPPFS
jgi:hypothetical protein